MGKGLSEAGARWLEARKLDVEVATKLGTYSAGPSIRFPYLLADGTELYAKCRPMAGSGPQFCTPKGLEQLRMWGEEELETFQPEPNDLLIITEGEPDRIAVAQVGAAYHASIPSGVSDKAEGCVSKALKFLTEPIDPATIDPRNPPKPVLKDWITRWKRIAIFMDDDAAGRLMRDAMIDVIGDEYCWVPQYPTGVKDANDVILEHGEEALRKVIDSIVPVKSDGFTPLNEIDSTPPTTLDTGIAFFDPHMRVTVPEFIVIGGTSGAGKSTVTQNIVFNLCAKHGLKASLFCGEGAKQIVLLRARRFWKCTKFAAGINPGDQRGHEMREEWIRTHLAFIEPPKGQPRDFAWFLWAMEQQALVRKRKIFVIDPWNQVLHLFRDTKINMTDYISQCIILMKALAERLGLILIIVHHVRKPARGEPVNGYMLEGSAHWYNAADHLLIVDRPEKEANETDLFFEKSRDHEFFGRPGRVKIRMQSDPFVLHQILRGEEDTEPGQTNGHAVAQGEIAF